MEEVKANMKIFGIQRQKTSFHNKVINERQEENSDKSSNDIEGTIQQTSSFKSSQSESKYGQSSRRNSTFTTDSDNSLNFAKKRLSRRGSIATISSLQQIKQVRTKLTRRDSVAK